MSETDLKAPRAAYVVLEAREGRVKLFGTVVGAARAYYVFVPDRTWRTFRKGKRRPVAKEFVRFQTVEVES